MQYTIISMSRGCKQSTCHSASANKQYACLTQNPIHTTSLIVSLFPENLHKTEPATSSEKNKNKKYNKMNK